MFCKRFAALFVALVLMLGVIPAQVFAEDMDLVAYPVTGGNLYFDKETGAIVRCDDTVTEAIIPETIDGVTVRAIGYYYPFRGKDMLKKVFIPKTVTEICFSAFGGSENLKEIQVDAENPCYSTDASSVIFNVDKTKLFEAPCGLQGAYTIPSTVREIEFEAFWACTGLTSVVIPEGVERINNGTFDHCTSLESVTIPASMKGISSAFLDCDSLKEVHYGGTEAQWKELILHMGAEDLCFVTVYYNGSSTGKSLVNTWQLFNGVEWRYIYADKSFGRLHKDRSSGGDWHYCRDGEVDTSFTGLAKNMNGWWYVNKGKVDYSYTGLAKSCYGWYYVKNGKVDYTYTGLAKSPNGWYYTKNGKVDYSYTGLAKSPNGWYYAKNGKVDYSYTGLAKSPNGWYYTKNGKVNYSYTGLAKSPNGWYYTKNGKVDYTYTGLAKSPNGWYYAKNGKVNYSFTGLAKSPNGIYYAKNGKVDYTFNGTATYNGHTYTVVYGKART